MLENVFSIFGFSSWFNFLLAIVCELSLFPSDYFFCSISIGCAVLLFALGAGIVFRLTVTLRVCICSPNDSILFFLLSFVCNIRTFSFHCFFFSSFLNRYIEKHKSICSDTAETFFLQIFFSFLLLYLTNCSHFAR